MTLPFSVFCQLLHDLEQIATQDPPPLPTQRDAALARLTSTWFSRHRETLRQTDGVALLSTFFPERRTDRVYHLQPRALSHVLGRCYHMSAARFAELRRFALPGHGDLAECLERDQRRYDAEPRVRIGGAAREVTVEEVDRCLQQLAGRCRFSDAQVRGSAGTDLGDDPLVELLRPVYWRLRAREGKWLTRLILKDFSPVVVDPRRVLECYHFLMPDLLKVQDDFGAAVRALKSQFARYPWNPEPESAAAFRYMASTLLKPEINIKVGRPTHHKAWSLNHCIKLCGGRKWVVERKYDGEYAEIHVDLTSSPDAFDPACIKIFSKSGKDSTQDRANVHDTVRRSLRLGTPECFIKRKAILLAELVVWCDRDQKVLPFDHIRRHVSRSGQFLGKSSNDFSSDLSNEHLALVYFDILLLDDDVMMRRHHAARRQALGRVVRRIKGRSMTALYREIDFGASNAPVMLAKQLGAALGAAAEGLVLKPADRPYLTFSDPMKHDRLSCHGHIKLKKDYLTALGGERDVCDLVVVGALYDSRYEKRMARGLKGVKYTKFFLGCLVNAEEVRFDSAPKFQVVGTLGDPETIPKPVFQALNEYGRANAIPSDECSDARILSYPGTGKMTSEKMDVFWPPPVVEVLGSGFLRPPSCDFMMLRHARMLKLHTDRPWTDAITFEALQEAAEESKQMTKLVADIDAACVPRSVGADAPDMDELANHELEAELMEVVTAVSARVRANIDAGTSDLDGIPLRRKRRHSGSPSGVRSTLSSTHRSASAMNAAPRILPRPPLRTAATYSGVPAALPESDQEFIGMSSVWPSPAAPVLVDNVVVPHPPAAAEIGFTSKEEVDMNEGVSRGSRVPSPGKRSKGDIKTRYRTESPPRITRWLEEISESPEPG